MADAALILEITANPSVPVGYGDQFRCSVTRVLAGDFAAETLFLTIMAGETTHLDFMAAHPPPQRIEAGFDLAETNAPYATMPVTGFVDAARNVWALRFLREAGTP